MAKRRAQIMRDRIRKGLQLLIGIGELSVSPGQFRGMASAQGFDLFPLGNIADGAGDHGAFGGLEGTQADLGGENAAVLAAPDKIQARMDWPSAGRAIINVALGRMLPARFFRQQYFDWLAEKFLARVAEELLRL